ncbi:MAG: hypothetical protein WA322_17960 [Pseudolabrys sp.]
MATDLNKTSLTTDFAELFGAPPVLSSEDHQSYDAMLARILQFLKASDFIDQMLGKDLTDATWEVKRNSRHKAFVIELKRRKKPSNWKTRFQQLYRLEKG